MRSRFATRPALALALLAACTPTGDSAGQAAAAEHEASHAVAYRVDAEVPRDSAALVEPLGPGCGAISVEPTGPWEEQGERLAEVREAWHPRAEHGRPTAIRDASPPFALPGVELLQVRVEGAARALQPCFTHAGETDGTLGHIECLPAWVLLAAVPPPAQPQTNEQWAQLIGLLDGASAVISDPVQLERCVALPPPLRARVPWLGLRRTAAGVQAAFIERIDAGPALTMLVTVSATLADGRLELEHEELWTVDHEELR
jgi:hypothetical protein